MNRFFLQNLILSKIMNIPSTSIRSFLRQFETFPQASKDFHHDQILIVTNLHENMIIMILIDRRLCCCFPSKGSVFRPSKILCKYTKTSGTNILCCKWSSWEVDNRNFYRQICQLTSDGCIFRRSNTFL